MPVKRARNIAVSVALSRALRQRRLSHQDVAKVLGLKEQTVSNYIHSGHFNSKKARKWSETLDIPIEVFTYGVDPLPPNDYQAIMDELASIRAEMKDLSQSVFELKLRLDSLIH